MLPFAHATPLNEYNAGIPMAVPLFGPITPPPRKTSPNAKQRRLDKERLLEERKRELSGEFERKQFEKRQEQAARDRIRAERDLQRQQEQAEKAEEKRIRAERDLQRRQEQAKKAEDKRVRDEETQKHQYKKNMLKRVKAERALTRQFPAPFENVTCGLTPADEFTYEELENLPLFGSMETLINESLINDDAHPRQVLELAMRAFDAQVRRFRLWETNTGIIMRQGKSGFNAKTTEVLTALHVKGAQRCGETRDDGTLEPMLHQATTRALLHPLTPVSRALVIHPTGTGKSLVMIQTLDNFFYDTRDKVIVVPTTTVLKQIVADMIKLLPKECPLKRWYIHWKAEIKHDARTSDDKLTPIRQQLLEALDRYESGVDKVEGDDEYLWYVVAALKYNTMLTRSASLLGTGSSSRPQEPTYEHEDDDFEDEDDNEDEKESREKKSPDMFPDKERIKRFNEMREGSRMTTHTWELRSKIIFMTYRDHMLKFYRNDPVFKRTTGRIPSVSFNDKIVLVDEMHNLFDEVNPNLNRVERSKIFGDKVKRAMYTERLKEAIACYNDKASCKPDSKGKLKTVTDSDIRKLKDAVVLYSGMRKVMQRCSRCILIGLTATPIVEGDGVRAAVQVLNWIRGSAVSIKRTKGITKGDATSDDMVAQSDVDIDDMGDVDIGDMGEPPFPPLEPVFQGSVSRYRAAGSSTDPLPPPSSPTEGGSGRSSPKKKRGPLSVDLKPYEGYVSVFGVKPAELFARADEVSYPNLMPIPLQITSDFLEPGLPKHEDEGYEVLNEDDESKNIPTYGIGGLQGLIAKYLKSKRAKEWFHDHLEDPPYIPGANSDHIEYWERSKAWTPNPMLYRTETEMPRWSEKGLFPFGRSPPLIDSCAWVERQNAEKTSTSWRETRQPCWVRSDITFKEMHSVKLDDTGTLSRTILGRRGTLYLEIGSLTNPLVRPDEIMGITILKDRVKILTSKTTHELYKFDAPLKGNTRRTVLNVKRQGSTKAEIDTIRGSVTDQPEFYVIREAGEDIMTVANLTIGKPVSRDIQYLDYTPRYYYYEKSQRVLYRRRLKEFEQDEGAFWMNVFYGGRQTKGHQANAVQSGGTSVGGILNADAEVSGFAIDMARAIVKDAFSREGKTLWLLHEAHGLALVRQWLQSSEANGYGDTSRIRLFGAFRADDRKRNSDAVGDYLGTTYNAAFNVNGDVCKLFIGGAGDLGVGITFEEVRHIYLDLTPSYFSIIQQMGRGQRLCKHVRLPESKRTLTFHLPFPFMHLEWGAEPVAATSRGSRGGIGTVSAQIDDYQPKYKIGIRRETISAPLHVPLHALDALENLQRSRFQFYAGMQLFQDVAIDAKYYENVAGWKPVRIELANEPNDRPKVVPMVRQLVKESLESIRFLDGGVAKLTRMSRENKQLNEEARDNPPDEDERRSRSKHDPKLLAYLEELAVRQGKQEKKDHVAQQREEKEAQRSMKEARKKEEEVAKRKCVNYDIKGWGTIVRKDRPGEKVNQAQAIRMISEGAKGGDPNCRELFTILRMYDVVE